MSDKKLSQSDFTPYIERQQRQEQQSQQRPESRPYSISYDPHASTPTKAVYTNGGGRGR